MKFGKGNHRKPRDLDAMLASLAEAAELGEGRVPDAELAAARNVAARANERRALSSEHTVVGLFGATGSGKSTLFNAIVGEEVARTRVRRPTTSEALAAVWEPRGSDALLDWLEVRERRVIEHPFAGGEPLPIVCIDLPDFDSVALEHRAIAERLSGQVDVLVWVVDPQKYADAVIHREFIGPLASHAAVTTVVLNQIDLVPSGQVPELVASLQSLLRQDGLQGMEVLPVSARTGTGVDAVQARIARFAIERVAASDRLAADVTAAARALEAAAWPDAEGPSTMRGTDTKALEQGLAKAARVDAVSRAVASSYRKRGGQITGWPVTSWVLRLAPDPLRRMHLALGSEKDRDSDVHRSSLPPMGPAERAKAGQAVRDYTDSAVAGLGDGWARAIRERASETLEILPPELDRAIARTDLGAKGSWWWPLFGALQWIALIAAIVGGVWLLLPIVLPMWGMVAPVIPQVAGTDSWLDGWPIPLVGVIGGALLGVVLGLMGALIGGAIGAARRARARRRMLAQVRATAEEHVVAPIEAERTRATAFAEALAPLVR